MKMPKNFSIKKVSFVIAAAALILVISILISNSLVSSEPGYFELLEVKEERIQSIYYNIFYVKWHGRTTELKFSLHKYTRVAGYPVPGGVGVKWIKTNGENVSVRDGNFCLVKNGDKFKLSLSIFATHVKISYENKSVWFYGSGEMEESSQP